jgi:hypothetical protein
LTKSGFNKKLYKSAITINERLIELGTSWNFESITDKTSKALKKMHKMALCSKSKELKAIQKNKIPVTNSIKGYWVDILSLQKEHLPLNQIKLSRGMFK